MDRLISEQAVLDVINKAIKVGRFYYGKNQTIEEIKSIQSAESKTGHWIMTNDYYAGAYGNIDYVECSCCHEYSLEEGNFCPNCGAKMIELQEA